MPVAYVEHLVPTPWVACTWEQVASRTEQIRVVPDGCVDLIWSGNRLSVAGPDTLPRLVQLDARIRLVGARIRIGAAGSILGMSAAAIRDFTPDASDVLGCELAAELLDQLNSGVDPHALLARTLEQRGAGEPDPLVGAAISRLALPQARVDSVADGLGVSSRHLQRLMNDAVGYGPKMLARVLRFRRLQALSPGPLADLARKAGYCDQAHMTSEVTRLSGIPPVRFLKDRVLTSG